MVINSQFCLHYSLHTVKDQWFVKETHVLEPVLQYDGRTYTNGKILVFSLCFSLGRCHQKLKKRVHDRGNQNRLYPIKFG